MESKTGIFKIPSYRHYDSISHEWFRAVFALEDNEVFRLNWKKVNGAVIGSRYHFFKGLGVVHENCAFCRCRFEPIIEPELGDQSGSDGVYSFVSQVLQCPSCGYWELRTNRQDDSAGWYYCAASKLNEYPEASADVPVNELASYLKAHPQRIYNISPTALEKLVAECFRSTRDYCEVMHVGQPSDGGVDVLLISWGKQKILVQVKRRQTSEKAESVGTLRNLLGAMVLEHALNGIIVSTADHFSFRAHQEAKRLYDDGTYEIELRDCGRLRAMIDAVDDPRPWLGYLTELRNRRPRTL
jgi:hypothetical protein